MRKAAVAARLELRSLERHYRDMGWEVALGASGTIKAIDRVLRANEWSERGITLEGLERLREELLSAGHVERLKLAGLSEERAPVLPSGLAILLGIFDSLELRSMTASTGALREGVLYDLIGRIRREDVRERTIASFQQRYAVDRPFAARVERTARELFSQVAEAWQLDEPAGRRFLSWAARLHEIGLSLSHSGHHRHAAYIVRNSDMPGFSRDDQEMLAAIVLGHRRRVTRDRLGTLVAPGRVETALRLCICLRIARRLNRVRTRRAILTVRMEASENGVRVVFPRGWLEEHPLTWADLEDEAWVLRTTGYEMEVVSEGELSSS